MIDVYSYLPPDRTPEETKILEAVMSRIYQKLDDPKDKFIVAFRYHLGFGMEETARAMGISYVAVWKRVKKIERILNTPEVKDLPDKNID